jgi:hypothetical protein
MGDVFIRSISVTVICNKYILIYSTLKNLVQSWLKYVMNLRSFSMRACG